MESNTMRVCALRVCATCVFQDANRGFCWCPERGATDEEGGYVFSKVSQQTESEGRVEDETCQWYYHR